MNLSLNQAKKKKNDEFYTLLEDIEEEMSHYDFTGKIIYCNCDDHRYSNFYKYFKSRFKELGIKKLMATCLALDYLTEYDGIKETYTEHSGDFRDCNDLLQEADYVITNPPFSLFTEFVKILMDNNKKFIILGNINAFSYKDMFSWLTQSKIWLGNRPLNKDMYFNVPDVVKEYFLKEKKEGSAYVIKDNQVLGRLASACWYTNISRPNTKKLKLECKYSPDKYQKYDNYDVINVDRVKDIPYDYTGVMGVPITYLGVHNPLEYEILGIINWNRWIGYECYAIVNGKHKYQRLIIKKRPAP